MIKEINYTKDFGERLKIKRDMMDFPRNVFFEVTHRCNLYCQHCYVVPQPNKRELNTDEVKSIFRQLVDAGCLHLTLTGGEPLVREDIFSLIDYGRRIGLFIHLFTNATFITPQVADRLKEFQLISLEISFHSLKKERFDWFTGIKGSFDKAMKAIRLLKERKIDIALKITLHKGNLDEVDELKKFGNDLKAFVEWETLIQPRADGSKDNLFLRLSPEEVLKARRRIFSAHKDIDDLFVEETTDKNSFNGKLFQCGVGEKNLTVSPYGELKPCLDFPAPGYFILDNNLKQIWKMLGTYVDSFKPNSEYKCPHCKLRSVCTCCPIKAWLECGDMNACPQYYRQRAELTARNIAKESDFS